MEEETEPLGTLYSVNTEDENEIICSLLKSALNTKDNDGNCRNCKKELRLFIFQEIKEQKLDLIKLKNLIEEKWHKSLNAIENAYVETKYVKYCSNFWLDDISLLINEVMRNIGNKTNIISFRNINFIDDVPDVLKNSGYYRLLRKHSGYLSKEQEKHLVYKITKLCMEHIYNHSETAKKELEFLDNLSTFLDSCEHFHEISSQLDLANFTSGKTSFEDLLTLIVNLKTFTNLNVTVLKECAKFLLDNKNYVLVNDIRKVISDHFKPIEIEKKELESRCLIEVKGRNVRLSEILITLEKQITTDISVLEVQFIIFKKFYIDENLKKDIWHGINIAILAQEIIIVNNISWNVSGKNNDHIYKDDAGTDDDSCGKDGSDGLPGESGGNILILAHNVTNAENFSLMSTGGNGSDGQDGGKGKDGENGQSISRSEFHKQYPSVVKFACDRSNRKVAVKETVNKIKKCALTIQTEWYSDPQYPGDEDVYIVATSRQGNEITFSYCAGGFTRRYQGFLLYKGSVGKPGKRGGGSGLGGEGGFGGDIEVKHFITGQEFKVIKLSKNGDEGKIGKVGSHGKYGKNSWDMGYMDYQFWGSTQVYDSSECNINLVFYEYNSSTRIWCPYKEYNNSYAFAEMSVNKVEHKQQTNFSEQENSEKKKKRQHTSRAVKKKNILQSNLNLYIHSINVEHNNKLHDLTTKLENIELHMKAFTLNKIREQNLKMESKINNHASYNLPTSTKRKFECGDMFIVKKDIEIKSSYADIIKILKNLPKANTLNKVFQLKYVRLNLDQLTVIYEQWLKSMSKISKNQDLCSRVEQIFVEKYRVAILQEIGIKVFQFEETQINKNCIGNEVSVNDAMKYLTRTAKHNNIYHNVFGSLDQYFFDSEATNHERISKFCMENILKNDDHMLDLVLSMFLSDLINVDLADDSIKHFNDDYNEFSKKKENDLNLYYNIFQSEVSKPRHKCIHQSFYKNNFTDTSIQIKDAIEKDSFLKPLYKRLAYELENKYNWKKCLQDSKFLKKFEKYIKLGPISKGYREIVANIFDVNIRIYQLTPDHQFTLFDSHNASATNVVYLLFIEDIFYEISIKTDLIKFVKVSNCLNIAYCKILSDVYKINSTSELSKYWYQYSNSFDEREKVKEPFHKIFDEEEGIKNIAIFFSEVEQQNIIIKLQKISSQYIQNSNIIYIILKRLENEGRDLSYKEMCYVSDLVLSLYINSTKVCFDWIFASEFQSNWMAELVLLQIEHFFMKCLISKCQIRKYLGTLSSDILVLLSIKLQLCKESDIVVSISCIEDTLLLLNNVSNLKVNLDAYELSEWPYILKEYFWIYKLEELFNWKLSNLDLIPYYMLSLENMFGSFIVNEFLKTIAKIDTSKNIRDVFLTILENFHDERWNLGNDEISYLKIVPNILEWVKQLDIKFYASHDDRNANQLATLIKSNSNTTKSVLNNLPNVLNTLKNINGESYSIYNKPLQLFTVDDIKSWVNNLKIENIFLHNIFGDIVRELTESELKLKIDLFRRKEYKPDDVLNEQILSLIDRAIEIKRGFKLRDTQKLAILSLLFNKNSILAQVSTGEGKSLIVVALTIMRVIIYKEKVDIITSSSVLAMRDAMCNKDIYDIFQIYVGHNCSENVEKRREAYSNNSVIYGVLSNFQRDYLLDRFYGKNILGDHNFSNVIIDEVDSMLLDKGNNMLYLSHDIAGLDKLESLYVYIWCAINQLIGKTNSVSEAVDIKESVINDLYINIKKKDMENLDPNLNEIERNSIWNYLINSKIINDKGRLLVKDLSNVNLNNFYPELCHVKEPIKHFLKECLDKKRFIHVPEYLKPFIEIHLESWINSAMTAFFMKPGENYVVDIDRAETSNCNPIITIVDTDTGTDQNNSQWDEALHQFLQLKHGCKLTMQSLKAVFISNVSFFKLYRRLYGLTGTLGSQRERDLLKEVHDVDYVTIPTSKIKRFHEDLPIVCKTRNEWVNNIYDEAKTIIDKRRSILIICQSVNDVEFINKCFKDKNKNYVVHTYTRDYEEFDIALGSKKLEECQIILATNLAGRGTDIILSNELKERGGLHVCLTYLPSNIRIERQAFGRAARCGDQGSGRLIILDTSYQDNFTSKVLNLKKDRDREELNRISLIKSNYENKIQVEENCFEDFKKTYEKIKKEIIKKNIPEDIRTILLQNCLDKWAFWLDKSSKRIQVTKNNINKQIFYDSFKDFLTPLEDLLSDLISNNDGYNVRNLLRWVKENPLKMLYLGKFYLKEKKYEEAQIFFDKIIEYESEFSEAAHYYKAFAISKQIDWEDKQHKSKLYKKFKGHLRVAAKLLHRHNDRALYNATVIDRVQENYPESIVKIDAFTRQQNIFGSFYNMFIKSIDDILGPHVTPEVFVSFNINENMAQTVYEDLLRVGVLNKTKIKKTFDESMLKSISCEFGISSKKLYEVLNTYKGTIVNDNKFLKILKKEVKLPSREELWNILKEQQVLYNDEKFAIVDTDKLSSVDPPFLQLIKNSKHMKTEIYDIKDDKNCENNMKDTAHVQIFLKEKCVSESKNNKSIILSVEKLKSLDSEKYKMLKRMGLLTLNKKAFLDKSKLKSATSILYNSINAEDFEKINVDFKKGESILSELVSQGFLVKSKIKGEHQNYALKADFKKISQLKIMTCPIYTNSVQQLLFTCFAYKIALEKLKKQLDENVLPVQLQLISKPHHGLIFDLCDLNIVKRIKMSNSQECDIEKTLKTLYSLPISKQRFIDLLVENNVIAKQHVSDLFDDLLEKKWIIHHNVVEQLIADTVSKTIGLKDLDIKLYHINKNSDARISLNPPFKGIEESLNYFLDNRLKLAEESTIQTLLKTAKQLKKTTKSIDVPDNNLKLFTDVLVPNKFLNPDEVYIMFLNGLEYIQYFDEKKHTKKMVLSAAFVFGMGIIQIATGVIIQVFSMGLMTHVASVLISEGISDMLYATCALKSGYFSWSDYKKHKLRSLIFSTITVGVGAFLSRSAVFSKFGEKLFGPQVLIDGVEATKVCGWKLLETAGYRAVAVKVVQQMCIEATKGMALCIANYGADSIIDKYLKSFCENIGATILMNIDDEVDKHALSNDLFEFYNLYGETKSKNAIMELTDSFFSKHNYEDKVLPIAQSICSSVTKGITEAVMKNKGKSGLSLQFSANVISKLMVWSNRAKNISMIRDVTKELLNNLHEDIESKLVEMRKKGVEVDGKSVSAENYDKFKKDITEHWKAILRQRAGKVIAQHVIAPILEDNLNKILNYCGKSINNMYRSIKENNLNKLFEARKKRYKEDSENAKLNTNPNEYSKVQEEITKNYNKDLINLMNKTKSPKLLGAIIREKVPMDLMCFMASASIVRTVLTEQGLIVPGLTLVVTAENGISQEILVGPKCNEKHVINIDLINNHFITAGQNDILDNDNGIMDNDCLFKALCVKIPELQNLGSENFRSEIAKCIEKNLDIQHHIMNGWHQLPISLNIYGGARKYVDRKSDPDSTDQEIQDVYQHIVDRFIRLIRFGGTIQRVSEKTNLRRSSIVKGGNSELQDRHSGLGHKYHASHVIRGVLDNRINEDRFPEIHKELSNILGHTQTIERYANIYRGLGGIMDEFQADAYKKMSNINFKSQSSKDEFIISALKTDFMERVNKYANRSNKLSEDNRNEIRKGLDILSDLKPEYIYRKGADGYYGKDRHSYL